jgi:hypothetical protein
MHAEDSVYSGPNGIEIAFTDQPITGWGGLALVARYFEVLGVREILAKALPDGRTSPDQVPVVDMAMTLLVTILMGGRRFSHVERFRSDPVLPKMFDLSRTASAMTITRYFGGFTKRHVQHLVEAVGQALWERLIPAEAAAVLDLDSTIFERYGQQDGSLKGHNPRKHGRPSHHPILAMLAGSKRVLHTWLRSGNTGTARGAGAFLDEALHRLPAHTKVQTVRADSGFFISDFLTHLEARGLMYAVAVRMQPPIRRAIAGMQSWRSFGRGVEVCELPWQPFRWTAPRRLVVVRELLRERPDAAGRRLFDLPGYTFHAVVTNLSLAPEEVWRFYNGRADCENRIKELKLDFAADGFCLRSFHGTEAVLQLNCLLFNLLTAFKDDVLEDPSPTLGTLRHSLFVLGGLLRASARRSRLFLGLLTQKTRYHLNQLLMRLAAIPPTVAHLDLDLPQPWRNHPPIPAGFLRYCPLAPA